jgi:hypothetical protein
MQLILRDDDARALRDLLNAHVRDVRLEVARTDCTATAPARKST